MRIQHWQDVASLLVGVWLVLSSFVLGISGAAVWITIALGLGVMLFAVGAAIAGWGLAIFYDARTTTVPGEASAKLVTWGPYRVTRNPMYVGLTLAYLGEAALLKQIWPIVFLPLVVAYVSWTVIPVEEARLKEVFTDEYERYRAKVRRWI